MDEELLLTNMQRKWFLEVEFITDEDAMNLCNLVGDMNCHINLIPVNPIKEREYVESERRDVLNFQNKLEKKRINVTVRREMGRDIDGACGQLRRRHAKNNAYE